MTRTELREHIFRIIFTLEFRDEEEMPSQIRLYFDQLGDVDEKDMDYIRTKAAKVTDKTHDIDELINGRTTGWKTSRMNKVDLSILRLAVYEILYDENIPDRVAIDEAVELAKKYSGEESPAFVNGVLAKFV